jgi:hypothetical protein
LNQNVFIAAIQPFLQPVAGDTNTMARRFVSREQSDFEVIEHEFCGTGFARDGGQ